MQSRSSNRIPSLVRWPARIVSAALILCACATSATRHPQQTTVRDESGFTINEEVQVSEEVRADFENAVHLLRQGQYESGIALLVKVTEQAPTVTTAHIDLAIAYSQVDDLERAEASIKQALELNPRHPVARRYGQVLSRARNRAGHGTPGCGMARENIQDPRRRP